MRTRGKEVSTSYRTTTDYDCHYLEVCATEFSNKPKRTNGKYAKFSTWQFTGRWRNIWEGKDELTVTKLQRTTMMLRTACEQAHQQARTDGRYMEVMDLGKARKRWQESDYRTRLQGTPTYYASKILRSGRSTNLDERTTHGSLAGVYWKWRNIWIRIGKA